MHGSTMTALHTSAARDGSTRSFTMARISVVWSAAARRVADAAMAMGMFALVAAFVVSGAREARAQSVTGCGSESFRNVDGLDGNVVKVAAG